MNEDRSIVVTNEFASIELRVEHRGNGAQALVIDRRSGVSRRVDVLALEGLVWAPEWIMASLADPGLGDSRQRAGGRTSVPPDIDPGVGGA